MAAKKNDRRDEPTRAEKAESVSAALAKIAKDAARGGGSAAAAHVGAGAQGAIESGLGTARSFAARLLGGSAGSSSAAPPSTLPLFAIGGALAAVFALQLTRR